MTFPVEERIGAIRAALDANRTVVLTAPPGSGKTTCVPPALLDAPWLAGKKIVMLEPRRLAARNCAQYIAAKRGEAVGETVGYQVRLERRISARTRLEVVTEGLLAQRLLADPELADTGLVIFDEFHERALPCDLAFALALEVRRALRPDLRLLVMSATLDADEVAAHLGDATIVHAEGRMYPVATEYLGDISMAAAVSKALRETSGDILCFLPGEGEIRRTAAALCGNFEVCPLYGNLPREEQDKVFKPCSRRKVILATSIAETSLTIPGITTVIDSGLMRIPRFSPATGMTGLVTLPLSQDRAEQRRGRAGRVQKGICYRLWTEAAQASRPRKAMPEILDADLSGLVLSSAAWGALHRTDLPWMTPPPASAWGQASSLLQLLGALDADGRLTPLGTAMSHLPMHPRLANMMLHTDAAHRSSAAQWAAILEEGGKSRETDIRYVDITPRIRQLSTRFSSLKGGLSPESRGLSPQNGGLSPGGSRGLSPEKRVLSPATAGQMLALAYPDRVARNRGNGTFQMVSGRGAFLEPGDPLASEPFLVCCELDDRLGDAKVFRACPIAKGEIEVLFADRLTEETVCQWDRANERVKSVVRQKLGSMTLAERPGPTDADTTDAMLAGVRVKGVENLPCWTPPARQLRARIAFLARHCGWAEPTDAKILEALAGFIGGMTKWRDLEKVDLFSVFDTLLSADGHDRRELDRLAPPKMEVPTGSHITIHYEGDEPTAEVRLQECFGLMTTPLVAGGQVPVVMTLLSPAQRPIQVTKDLAGFWRGAYQLVRKDMRGRYPRHYWPEDPLTAVATRRVRPRPQ